MFSEILLIYCILFENQSKDLLDQHNPLCYSNFNIVVISDGNYFRSVVYKIKSALLKIISASKEIIRQHYSFLKGLQIPLKLHNVLFVVVNCII